MDRAVLCVKARQRAAVGAAIEIITDYDGSLHVVALLRMDPYDGIVGLFDFRWGNVTFGFETNRTHRPVAAVSARKVRKPECCDRCRHGNVSTTLQSPNLFAGLEVIRSRVSPAVAPQCIQGLRGACPSCHCATMGLSGSVPALGSTGVAVQSGLFVVWPWLQQWKYRAQRNKALNPKWQQRANRINVGIRRRDGLNMVGG